MAVGMRSEGNTPKNGEPNVGFSLTIRLQHTDRFWSIISWHKTKQCAALELSLYSPDLVEADFYRFP